MTKLNHWAYWDITFEMLPWVLIFFQKYWCCHDLINYYILTFKKLEFYYWNFMIFKNEYTLKLLYEGFIRIWIFLPIWIYMITSLLYFLNWEFMLWIAYYYNELIFLKAFEIKVVIWVVLRDMYSYYGLKVSSAF